MSAIRMQFMSMAIVVFIGIFLTGFIRFIGFYITCGYASIRCSYRYMSWTFILEKDGLK